MPSNPPKSPCKNNLSSPDPGGQAGLQPPGEASFSRGSAVIAATLPRVQQVKSAVAESEREQVELWKEFSRIISSPSDRGKGGRRVEGEVNILA